MKTRLAILIALIMLCALTVFAKPRPADSEMQWAHLVLNTDPMIPGGITGDKVDKGYELMPLPAFDRYGKPVAYYCGTMGNAHNRDNRDSWSWYRFKPGLWVEAYREKAWDEPQEGCTYRVIEYSWKRVGACGNNTFLTDRFHHRIKIVETITKKVETHDINVGGKVGVEGDVKVTGEVKGAIDVNVNATVKQEQAPAPNMFFTNNVYNFTEESAPMQMLNGAFAPIIYNVPWLTIGWQPGARISSVNILQQQQQQEQQQQEEQQIVLTDEK